MRFLSVPGPRDLLALVDRSGDAVEQIVGALPRIVPLVEGAERVVAEADRLFRHMEKTRQTASSLIGRIQVSVARVDTVIEGAEASAARVDSVIEAVDAIAGRVDQIAGRVERIARRVDAVAGQAEGVVGRAGEAVDGADTAVGRAHTVVQKVDDLAGQVDGVVGRAGGAVEDADAVVGRADALASRMNDLLETLEPSLRTLHPTLDRLARTMGAREVDAMALLLDQLPRLVAEYEEDVLPVLTTLRSVAPDIHDLLDVSRELNELLVKVPGMGRIKKKVEEEQAEEEQAEGNGS